MAFLQAPEFLIGLMKIVWINVIFSGDKAVVIALAAAAHGSMLLQGLVALAAKTQPRSLRLSPPGRAVWAEKSVKAVRQTVIVTKNINKIRNNHQSAQFCA